MPWDTSGEYVRSGHKDPDNYSTCRTIVVSEEKGIKATYCKKKGSSNWEIQSYLFAKDKGWTVSRAKAWFNKHKSEKSFEAAEEEITLALYRMVWGE